MPLFAVWATDHEHALAAREQARPAHRARLRAPGAPGCESVKVVLAGPTLSGSGHMNGTLLVVEADSPEAVRRFVDADPYQAAGVYRSIDIRPFVCGLGPLAPGGSS